MARMLLNLRGVPDDEAEDVRELLRANGVDYYETPPNRWGLSMGAIWIRDNDDVERARSLMDAYQRERQERVRAEHAERRRAGTHDTVLGMVWRNPARALLYLAIVGAILYFSVVPFLQLARS